MCCCRSRVTTVLDHSVYTLRWTILIGSYPQNNSL
jgi:hypothetical protein